DFRSIKQSVSLLDVLGRYKVELRGMNQSRKEGHCPYALTYASSNEPRVSALVVTFAFGEHEMSRLISPGTLNRGQGKRWFDHSDDHVKQKPSHAPVADRA